MVLRWVLEHSMGRRSDSGVRKATCCKEKLWSLARPRENGRHSHQPVSVSVLDVIFITLLFVSIFSLVIRCECVRDRKYSQNNLCRV